MQQQIFSALKAYGN